MPGDLRQGNCPVKLVNEKGLRLRSPIQIISEAARHLGLAQADSEGQRPALTPLQFAVICALIFFAALGVRLLGWHDNRFEALRVEWMVASDYKTSTEQLLSGDLKSFLGDPSLAGHPPGYPIVLAF